MSKPTQPLLRRMLGIEFDRLQAVGSYQHNRRAVAAQLIHNKGIIPELVAMNRRMRGVGSGGGARRYKNRNKHRLDGLPVGHQTCHIDEYASAPTFADLKVVAAKTLPMTQTIETKTTEFIEPTNHARRQRRLRGAKSLVHTKNTGIATRATTKVTSAVPSFYESGALTQSLSSPQTGSELSLMSSSTALLTPKHAKEMIQAISLSAPTERGWLYGLSTGNGASVGAAAIGFQCTTREQLGDLTINEIDKAGGIVDKSYIPSDAISPSMVADRVRSGDASTGEELKRSDSARPLPPYSKHVETIVSTAGKLITHWAATASEPKSGMPRPGAGNSSVLLPTKKGAKGLDQQGEAHIDEGPLKSFEIKLPLALLDEQLAPTPALASLLCATIASIIESRGSFTVVAEDHPMAKLDPKLQKKPLKTVDSFLRKLSVTVGLVSFTPLETKVEAKDRFPTPPPNVVVLRVSLFQNANVSHLYDLLGEEAMADLRHLRAHVCAGDYCDALGERQKLTDRGGNGQEALLPSSARQQSPNVASLAIAWREQQLIKIGSVMNVVMRYRNGNDRAQMRSTTLKMKQRAIKRLANWWIGGGAGGGDNDVPGRAMRDHTTVDSCRYLGPVRRLRVCGDTDFMFVHLCKAEQPQATSASSNAIVVNESSNRRHTSATDSLLSVASQYLATSATEVVECVLEKRGLEHEFVVEELLTWLQDQREERIVAYLTEHALKTSHDGGTSYDIDLARATAQRTYDKHLRPLLPKMFCTVAAVIEAPSHSFQRIRIRGSTVKDVDAYAALRSAERADDSQGVPNMLGGPVVGQSTGGDEGATRHADSGSSLSIRHVSALVEVADARPQLRDTLKNSFVRLAPLPVLLHDRIETSSTLPSEFKKADGTICPYALTPMGEDKRLEGRRFTNTKTLRNFHGKSLHKKNSEGIGAAADADEIAFWKEYYFVLHNVSLVYSSARIDQSAPDAIPQGLIGGDQNGRRQRLFGTNVGNKLPGAQSSQSALPVRSLSALAKILADRDAAAARTADLRIGTLSGYEYGLVLRSILASQQPMVRFAVRRIAGADLHYADDSQGMHEKAPQPLMSGTGFLNYFAMNRFNWHTRGNMHPGLHLLKGEYRAAADLLAPSSGDGGKSDYILDIGGRSAGGGQDPKARRLRAFQKNESKVSKLVRSALTDAGIAASSEEGCRDLFRHKVGLPVCQMLVNEFLCFVWNDILSRRVRRFGRRTILVGDLVRPRDPATGNPQPPTANGQSPFIIASAADIASGRFTYRDVVMPIPGAGITLPHHDGLVSIYVNTLASYGITADTETGMWKIFTRGGNNDAANCFETNNASTGMSESLTGIAGAKTVAVAAPQGPNSLGLHVKGGYRYGIEVPRAFQCQISHDDSFAARLLLIKNAKKEIAAAKMTGSLSKYRIGKRNRELGRMLNSVPLMARLRFQLPASAYPMMLIRELSRRPRTDLADVLAMRKHYSTSDALTSGEKVLMRNQLSADDKHLKSRHLTKRGRRSTMMGRQLMLAMLRKQVLRSGNGRRKLLQSMSSLKSQGLAVD